ncbi:MAG: hypothetical protein L6R39_003719 [Caloplaca ligustica]|nr:MAG: hypothetical protein L6R39_003719 [Caloplaca ligustica]
MGSYTPEVLSLAEDQGLNIPEPAQTLHQILTQSVRQHPGRTALVSCHQPWNLLGASTGNTQGTDKKGYLRWTYTQLQRASELLASYLTKCGINQGDAVVVVLPSCAEWVLCFWAAARLGCPFVPINPAVVRRTNEINHILSALGRIGALVVDDESTATLLSGNDLAEVYKSTIRLSLGNVGMTGWTVFKNAFAVPDVSKPPAVEQNMQDTALVVLTSGTTTLPKGCPHSNASVASMCARHKIMYSLDETRVSCNHMPLFHLAGVMESLWAWAHGGTVVFPNHSFDARATLDAIDGERCTDMCLAPSMLRAMVDHPVLSSRNTKSLGLIKLAANDVLGSDARACSEILHAQVVTNCFGMSETSGITEIFAWRDGVCKDSEPFPAGRVAPGGKARICTPDSREPVKIGEIGELHLGGPTVTKRYIGGGDEVSRFYTDQHGTWHITGDRAVMAEDGVITVLGRYKDIINRAGENISPSVMERVLNQAEEVHSSQVVGVPDEVAGEVPVAVIKRTKDGNVSRSLLHELIIKELGTAFALERVIDLEELGIDQFPTTATSKVRKVDVRRMVIEHLREETETSTRTAGRGSTEAALTRIWARFSGVPENQISPTASLEGMVDSVTVMRFRSQVKKELGKNISLEELNQNPTVIKQAAILDRQQESVLRVNGAGSEPVRQGAPRLSDIVHARNDQAAFNEIRQEAERKLQGLGLSWDNDVEEVLPIYDLLQYWRAHTESIVFRIVFACANATTKQLRSALEKVLSVQGMLRTILLEGGLAGPSWVMIRSSSHWFDLAIEDGGTLKGPEDLLTTDLRPPGTTGSKPVPLFYIKIYFIEATQSAGFVVYGDHSTYDAHSVLSLFIEDLVKALNDPSATLPPRPRYKLFANAYYNYRSSVPAQLNLDHFTSRLKGIAQRRAGLWPRESFESLNSPPERSTDQLLLTGNITPGIAGIAKHIKIDMSTNQYLKVHKIPHVVAIKAAIAIFNTQQTGHPYAFFSNLQMCRSYPFLDPDIADRLPDIMDMPGATIEAALDNIHLDPTEPISTLLSRMHSEQNEQTARAQYPSLKLNDSLDAEDAAFLVEILRRQAFNYNPVVTPDPNAPLQNLQFAGNANLSFIWWCGMVDAETVQMRVTWNDEVFGLEDAEGAMDGFERNMRWLVKGESWDKTVGECDNH